MLSLAWSEHSNVSVIIIIMIAFLSICQMVLAPSLDHTIHWFSFFFIIARQSYRTSFPSLFFINSMPSYMWLLAALFEADFFKIKMGLLNRWLVLTSGAEWFIYGQMTTGFFSWPVACSQAHCRPLGSSCHHHPWWWGARAMVKANHKILLPSIALHCNSTHPHRSTFSYLSSCHHHAFDHSSFGASSTLTA